MGRRSSVSLPFCFCLAISWLAHGTSALHVHRHGTKRLHTHHPLPRDAEAREVVATASDAGATAVSTLTTGSTLPSITSGSALAHDVQEIQAGLNQLPGDLLKFIDAIESRLQGFENLFSSFLAGSTVAGPTPARTDAFPGNPSQTLNVSETATSRHSVSDFPAPFPTSEEVSSIAAAQTDDGTRTYTVTSTSTFSETITVYKATPSPINSTTSNSTVSLLASSILPSLNDSVLASSASIAIPSSLARDTSSSYTFDASSPHNVAVYYGQTPATTAAGLLTLCRSPNVDIVILAFVYDFATANAYPSAEFGPGCAPAEGIMQQRAPGLTNCSSLAAEIKACQKIGKKVLVSLGGAAGTSSFQSDAQAIRFASTVWSLFGAGTTTPHLRPFGTNVIVDGFDIDNEDHSTAHWTAFATALRKLYSAASAASDGRKYYLSAAPQCPFPDASIPMALMAQADFVWVQFYNNPQCNLGTDGFAEAFATWSGSLSEAAGGYGTSGGAAPRLYIGAPAFAAGGSGYTAGRALAAAVQQAKSLNVANMGGMMLWDGSEALANVGANGRNYLYWAKNALTN